jgi:PBSX family phage terminase large subunit
VAILTPKQLKEIKAQREAELQARMNEADARTNPNPTTPPSTTTTIDEALEEFKDYYPASAGSILHTLFNQKRCPRCNALLQPTPSISGAPSTDWLECSNSSCNTYVDTYHPMDHQTSVHLDAHRIIGNFGSYGTGKTKTSEKEIEKHIFITPNANILLGANITSQYEQTLLRDFEKSMPQAFMESRSQQKGYIDFINGARLMLRPFDDPDKLRSNNYSLVVMLEASEINADAFHQLKTRLRNTAATNPNTKSDWRKLICESNPDSGWIRTDVLLVSDEIIQHGRFADEDYHAQQDPLNIDTSIATHIASTDVNKYLPPDYITVNSKNKPDWWIKRFLYGSFLFAEGLVYPHAMNCVVPTPRDAEGNPLTPRHFPDWRVLVAHDYGLMDEATFVYAGVDKKRNKLVVYKVDHTNNAPLKDLANLFRHGTKDIAFGQMYTTPIIDPKNNKRDYDKKDLISHYQDYGITFKPGHVNVDARIIRLNDYIEAGCLEIWDCCEFLIKELKDYKFKTKTLDDKESKNRPIDANNHAINALEWIGMELPANPNRLSLTGYDEYGRPISMEEEKLNKKMNQSWQLDDIEPYDYPQYDTSSAFGMEGGLF